MASVLMTENTKKRRDSYDTSNELTLFLRFHKYVI